jgi:hypothetical protein
MSNANPRWLAVMLCGFALAGCGGADEADDNPDGSADTDTDVDTDTDTDSDTDTDTDTDADAGLCADAVDIMQPAPDGGAEIPTGIEECADGSRHRYAAIACTDLADGNGCVDSACGGCPEGQLCQGTYYGDCLCITPCATDAECADGEACVCQQAGTWATRCMPAGCRTDADCGEFECGVGVDACDHANGLWCRTAADACHGDAQCDGNYCSHVDASSSWECIEAADCD